MIRFPFFLLFCLVSIAPKAWAISSTSDSTATKSPLYHAISKYHEAIGSQASLFKGAEYLDYKYQTEGHPFFLMNHWGEGCIEFDGMEYAGVAMLYDVVDEAVVVALQNVSEGIFSKIRVDLDRVQRFTFKGHTFVRLEQDSAAAGMATGFYDMLYTGDSKVVAKRHKATKKEVALLVYSVDDSYFIRKDNQYHAVKSKASVLKLFKEHKKELSKYLRDNGINFKGDREHAIVRLAAQYDILQNK
ncbi:hypothetical protein [Pontibacter roseus]|uniref:hypothetical protein n=1 Tax=Pontibacter roseus TaxID=336989 RepID=UPI0003636570|nr:hypothetical protein [Pontibacter roseus]